MIVIAFFWIIFTFSTAVLSLSPLEKTNENTFCNSNPSLNICQQRRIIIPCRSQFDCPQQGNIFCNNQRQPSRFDCFLNAQTQKRECIRSYVHSGCTLWMPWYDRYIFSCERNNQLNWTLEYGFCHVGQFCTISNHQNFEKAICWNFAGYEETNSQ